MTQSATVIAEHATLQAFINCYLREIDAGVWHNRRHFISRSGCEFGANVAQVIELQLAPNLGCLAIGVCYRSLVGRHQLQGIYHSNDQQLSWRPLGDLACVLLLLDNLYVNKPQAQDHKLELLNRVIESFQLMQSYLQQRSVNRAELENYLQAEQSLVFGHWLHPTPKSRQGILPWQHQHYAPELQGEFALHYFAANAELVEHDHIGDCSAPQLALQLAQQQATPAQLQQLAQLAENQLLLPVHPLQAQWLLHQDYIQQLITRAELTYLGPLGSAFAATSSVRTVYNANCAQMLKLSIPVKITNSLRRNKTDELDAGLALARLFNKITMEERFGGFHIIADPAYLRLKLPQLNESGFETIFRDNPFAQPQSQHTFLIAALTQDPLPGQTVSQLSLNIKRVAAKQGISAQQAAITWFDAYWQLAIVNAIRLYDELGIALEVHQQNSLLQLEDGLPVAYYYRDNQGYYLAQSRAQTLITLEPTLASCDELFYDEVMINNRFSYYLLINQLFSIINRLGLDGLADEQQLLERVVEKLIHLQSQLGDLGSELVQQWLTQATLANKANLLTRIEDIDELEAELELARYNQLLNPIAVCYQQQLTSTPHYRHQGTVEVLNYA